MNMDTKDIENVLQITNMIAKFGIPMIASVMKIVKEKSPTIEQIHMLRETIKDPDEYFTDDGDIKPLLKLNDNTTSTD